MADAADQRARIVRILLDRWDEHGIRRSDPAALAEAAVSALEAWRCHVDGHPQGE